MLASGTLRLLFDGTRYRYFIGTVPANSDMQSFVIEFIITFYLMFIVSGVATDTRAVSINFYIIFHYYCYFSNKINIVDLYCYIFLLFGNLLIIL